MTDRVVVWSERNELHDPTGSEHDCPYSAILMVLVHGGKTSFPLGIYTAEEREALERSDDRPDEVGASPADIDTAILRRYGLGAHAPTTDIRTLLTTPGLAVSVGGQLSAFPAGSSLRRWAPNFTGGHRITFLTSTRTWLDPLAPWRFAGDIVTVNQVVTFAAKRAVGDLRYLRAGELIPTTGGTNIPGGDVKILRIKGEDFKATATVVLFADADPASKAIADIPTGTVKRSIAEAAGVDGGSWRLTEHAGVPAWFRYRNPVGDVGHMAPVVVGGSDTLDATLQNYIARK